MLKNLKLNNFRSLRSNSFDFSHGLQVVRGSNEAGKSTLLEAMLYALYGSRSLRNSLANTVTYGEKDEAGVTGQVVKVEAVAVCAKRALSAVWAQCAVRLDGFEAGSHRGCGDCWVCT